MAPQGRVRAEPWLVLAHVRSRAERLTPATMAGREKARSRRGHAAWLASAIASRACRPGEFTSTEDGTGEAVTRQGTSSPCCVR